jgi:hypothetical protein
MTDDRKFGQQPQRTDQSIEGPPGTVLPEEEGMRRQEDEVGGAEVPGVDVGAPDALQPDELEAEQAARRPDGP